MRATISVAPPGLRMKSPSRRVPQGLRPGLWYFRRFGACQRTTSEAGMSLRINKALGRSHDVHENKGRYAIKATMYMKHKGVSQNWPRSGAEPSSARTSMRRLSIRRAGALRQPSAPTVEASFAHQVAAP